MATENVLSAAITNRDAIPSVKTNSILKGQMNSAVGIVVCGTGDLGSTYRFFSLPSNALVKEIKIYSPDMGTTGLADVGLYDTTANGGLVVDADFFASAIDMKTAALNGSDITHEAGTVFSIANSEKPLWLALGLASDPCKEYDVVLTTTEAFSAGGTVKLAGEFMI